MQAFAVIDRDLGMMQGRAFSDADFGERVALGFNCGTRKHDVRFNDRCRCSVADRDEVANGHGLFGTSGPHKHDDERLRQGRLVCDAHDGAVGHEGRIECCDRAVGVGLRQRIGDIGRRGRKRFSERRHFEACGIPQVIEFRTVMAVDEGDAMRIDVGKRPERNDQFCDRQRGFIVDGRRQHVLQIAAQVRVLPFLDAPMRQAQRAECTDGFSTPRLDRSASRQLGGGRFESLRQRLLGLCFHQCHVHVTLPCR